MCSPLTSGFDPYDALLGRRIPSLVHRSRRGRQLAVQVRKRTPIDLSGLFGISPFVMAKTIGCMLTAAARERDREKVDALLRDLREAGGNLGNGTWGYEFDVQTRWAFYPSGSPNLIATVFVARGLGGTGLLTGDDAVAAEMGLSALFLRSLLRTGSAPYFCYTPTSERLVHNANLLGAGFVGMDSGLHSDVVGLEIARSAALTSIAAQREDGSWPYGEGSDLDWSDSFHTAYILDGLLQVWLATGDKAIRDSLDKGIAHWTRDFFGFQGEPKYYANRPYPYDIHSAATAVDVAARLATWGWNTGDIAERVAHWTHQNLVDSSSGETYYQKHRLWTDRRHFVRWGDAHWALGQSALTLLCNGQCDSLEYAVARASGVVLDAG